MLTINTGFSGYLRTNNLKTERKKEGRELEHSISFDTERESKRQRHQKEQSQSNDEQQKHREQLIDLMV